MTTSTRGAFHRVLSAFMFHHLGPDVKERALREVWRVLKPGGSLHLVDIDGAAASSGGFVDHLLHRNQRLRDTVGDRVLVLLHAAGFAHPTAVAQRFIRVVGPVAYYRATVLRAESGAAHHGTGPWSDASS